MAGDGAAPPERADGRLAPPGRAGAPARGAGPTDAPRETPARPRTPGQPGAPGGPGQLALWGAVAFALVSISLSAIFIRWAEAPALTVATNRMLASVVLLLPPTLLLARRDLLALGRRDLVALGLSGACLAAHFGTWTASLDYTSVASSVVFVCAHPIFVALLEWRWLGKRLRRAAWIGILLTLAGSVLIGAHDLQLGPDAAWGDFLALLGALAMVGYLVIGRRLRARMGFLAYSTAVYLVCWLALLAWTLGTGEDVLAFSAGDLVLFVLLAVCSTLGGHTVFNWALRHVSASAVAAVFVGEPVVAALLAWALLGEAVAPLVALGGAIILLGIYLTARADRA